MLNKILTVLAFIGVLMMLVGCGAAAAPALIPEPTVTSTAQGMIVLGDISDEPGIRIERFQPLADYLAARLGDFEIGSGTVKIAPDIETMARWLASGEVDLYFDSPYPAMIVSDISNAQPILRRWKGGDATYHSVLITRADAGIASIKELEGQLIGLEAPFSTSGYLLPVAYLKEANLNPVEKSGPEATVAENEVGYVFTGSDINTLQWLISGRVTTGAVDNQIFRALPEETQADCFVLAETETLPRQMVLVRPGLDPRLLEAIKTELLAMEEGPEGLAVLEHFVTRRFDEFPEGANQAFTQIRQIYDLVKD